MGGKKGGRREVWESDPQAVIFLHFIIVFTGEGNGHPLQYSCLENPRGRGAWWASVYGVAQSRTRLMWLSSSSSSSNLMSCCSQTWRNPLQPSDWALGSSFCLASSPPSCQCGSQTDSPQAGAYLSFQSVPFLGLPWWFMAKTPCSQCRRPGVQSLVREWDPMCCS